MKRNLQVLVSFKLKWVFRAHGFIGALIVCPTATHIIFINLYIGLYDKLASTDSPRAVSHYEGTADTSLQSTN